MAKSKSNKSSKKPASKKTTLIKGISMHVLTYVILCGILVMIGVPLYISAIIFFVLLWGLFVLSYAMWHEK